MDTVINTCLATTESLRGVASYAHLVPLVLGLAIAVLVFIRSKHSVQSVAFLSFVVFFCLWLAGDLVTWTSNNYSLVYATWSVLDYVNIMFFLFAVYFIQSLFRGGEAPSLFKWFYRILAIPAIYITLSHRSVLYFNQSVCEAVESDFLTKYKIVVEAIVILIVIFETVRAFKRSLDKIAKRRVLLISSFLLLFLVVFSMTEYVATITDVYEINLYSLFLLPVFLIGLMYAIVNFGTFNLKMFGTYMFVFGFLIVSASQFLFISDKSDTFLTTISLILSISFSLLLFRNLKRETEQRKKIENLSEMLEHANERLTELDKTKNEFLSFATHQLRSPLTSMRWGLDSLHVAIKQGKLSDQDVTTFEHIQNTTGDLIGTVGDLLDLSKIEQGGLVIQKEHFNLYNFVSTLTEEFKPTAEHKGLILDFESKVLNANIFGDRTKLRQVFVNLIDNAIKYTPNGSVKVHLVEEGGTVKVSVSDTGPGISKEEQSQLFDKFARGKAGRASGSGSGLGLHLAKKIVELHDGKISVSSDGEGRGSTFSVALPISG